MKAEKFMKKHPRKCEIVVMLQENEKAHGRIEEIDNSTCRPTILMNTSVHLRKKKVNLEDEIISFPFPAILVGIFNHAESIGNVQKASHAVTSLKWLKIGNFLTEYLFASMHGVQKIKKSIKSKP